ncbi:MULTISPECIES: hypothetical protein [unclassified Polaribacter]|uniref:hypothetical protein n=1 Tax=unclassified Polaribacter TaxID=196858 RepID=UPI0011BE89C9|nr:MULTISPECIES: hypothetical protein [unclassified Polaribacter]TXD51856.1 hypothetical protein ES043_10215 [Polaribacter sp. IC063]TXD59405.1 hypothetical protein ES044_10280 [Polaribacter sp. IC066]
MRNIITILTLIISLQSFAQNSYDIENRKGKLFFNAGVEYRITPIYQNGAELDIINTRGAISVDAQSSGTALNFGLNYFITKNLSLGFSNSFRYDIITQRSTEISGDFGYSPAKNDLIFGYHFYLDYHFKVFKEAELFVRLGKSFLNRGTEFETKTRFFDNSGNPTITAFSKQDTAYEPWNFALGYKKNKLNLILGTYTSSITEYFVDGSSFIVPYLNLTYNFGKL